MPANAKKLIRDTLLSRNIRVSRTTDPDRIREFLSVVRPVATNHELIRIGGDSDGGYLVPNDLGGIEVCFSPGVSAIADFEEQLTRRGIKCFLADYSVEAPPVSNGLIDFEKKFLGTKSTDGFTTLEDWMNRKAPGAGDLILQMDIEGAEYGVIYETSAEILRRFRILVVEFHRMDSLCDSMGYELISLTFNKLARDFEVVHIHPNNDFDFVTYKGIDIPPLLEFTFLRKDRVRRTDAALTFPNRLDRPNVPGKPNVVLPRCWYQ